MRRADPEQVARNIALLIWDKEKKLEQLDKVQGITVRCTSDDHINIICEIHHDGIVRYLIEGTRSGMTVTADTETREIVRLPRGSKACITCETDMWVGDIQKYVKKWQSGAIKATMM